MWDLLFSSPSFWSTISTLAVVGAVLVLGFALRRHLWLALEVSRPFAEGLGKAVERLSGRDLPPAARHDLLSHAFLLFPLLFYALVVLIGAHPQLAAQLPFFIYLYFGTTVFSLVIASLLR